MRRGTRLEEVQELYWQTILATDFAVRQGLPFAMLQLQTRANCITGLRICLQAPSRLEACCLDPLAMHVGRALQAWLQGRADWPRQWVLRPRGTPFQKRVWRLLCTIPEGETRTYGQLAKILQTSARAVGMACKANPIPLLIPCHRVISRQGLGGFAGQSLGPWLEVKEWLLFHER